MISFQCPGCKATIEVPDQYQGRQAHCPTCSRKIRVPRQAAPSDSGGMPADEASASGTNVIILEGRAYQVRPKMEGLSLAAAAVVAASLAIMLIIGLAMPLYNAWLWSGVTAAAVVTFGILLVLPAQLSIGRSRGRKSGQTLNTITVLAGGVLLIVYLSTALLSSLRTDYSTCPQRLQAVYAALTQYARANDDRFPPRPETLVEQGYLQATSLTCPHAPGARAGDATYLRGRHGESVISWQNLDFRREPAQFPDDLIILFDGGPHHLPDGRRVYYVLLLDGSVRHVSEQQRDDVIREQYAMIQRVQVLRQELGAAPQMPQDEEAQTAPAVAPEQDMPAMPSDIEEL